MPNERDEALKEIEVQFRDSFQSSYLTLTSIIQGGLFAYLIYRVDSQESIQLFSITTLVLASSLAIIVMAWNEYMNGATVYRWVPTLWDSWIPFLLGASEAAVIYFSHPLNLRGWCFSLALLSFIATIAFVNMHYRTSKFPDMEYLLKRLGAHKNFSSMETATYVGVFAALGIWAGDRNTVVAVALFTLFIYYVSRIFYWKRLKTTPSSS